MEAGRRRSGDRRREPRLSSWRWRRIVAAVLAVPLILVGVNDATGTHGNGGPHWHTPGQHTEHSRLIYWWTYWSGDINVSGDADCGNRVRAYRRGRVIHVDHSRTSYGINTLITHPINDRETLYAHQRGERVHVGEFVRKGEWIGRVGTTGNSTGCHLHFEIRP